MKKFLTIIKIIWNWFGLHKTIRNICGILVIVVATATLTYCFTASPKVDTKLLNQRIQKESDLITAKLTCDGWSDYDAKDGIPFVNQTKFILVYEFEVTAGIDITKVNVTKVDDANKMIYVDIPAAAIKTTKVKPDTIQYFDEQFKLLNFKEKEDADAAQAEAEEDAEKEALKSGILELADQQSETLIKGLLAEMSNGYEFEFTKIES